jgi:hypothetical protein
MKAQSFTTQKACIHCYILWLLWRSVSDRRYFLYLCSAIKMALDIMSWQTSAVMHVSWTQSSSGKGIVYSNSAPINTCVYNFLLGVISCLKQIYFKWNFTNPLTTDTQDQCIKLQTRLHTVLTARIWGVWWLPSKSSWWDARALDEFYYFWLQSFFTFRSCGVFIIQQTNYNKIMSNG